MVYSDAGRSVSRRGGGGLLEEPDRRGGVLTHSECLDCRSYLSDIGSQHVGVVQHRQTADTLGNRLDLVIGIGRDKCFVSTGGGGLEAL